MAPVAQGQAPGNGLESVPVDEAVARSTANALLDSYDEIKTNWITKEARQAGATSALLDRFRHSVALSKNSRDLLVKLSPDICAEMQINPRRFCVYIAAAIVVGDTVSLWQAVSELRDLRKEKAVEPLTDKAAAIKASQQQPAPQGMMPPIQIPPPERPKGAPPQVT
jgi:hypothetical protein